MYSNAFYDQMCHLHADLASGSTWQPRGILAAHLAEHRRGVNCVAVARGGAFFVTASDDETCKIWDTRRLEKDVSFGSKLTYASQARPFFALLATLCKKKCPGRRHGKG